MMDRIRRNEWAIVLVVMTLFAVASLASHAHGQPAQPSPMVSLPPDWQPKLLNKQQTKERYEQIGREIAERQKRAAELRAAREARQAKRRERVEEMRRDLRPR